MLRWSIVPLTVMLFAPVCLAAGAEQPSGERDWRELLDARRGTALVERWDAGAHSPSELLPVFDPVAERFRAWDATERSLAWSYVALSLADVYQSTQIPEHGREANPLVSSWAGGRPDEAEVVLFKAVTTWGLLHLTKRYVRSGPRRKQVLSLLNTFQMGVVVHNERIRRDDFGRAAGAGR